MFKVCLDDFGPTNVENIALLLEGCGRFLLRNEETKVPFGKMVRLICHGNVTVGTETEKPAFLLG